jgi:hypothetical protein
MHCYNLDFSNLAILPPYNTLVSQVIVVSDPPQIVTSSVIVKYSFTDNTYSVNKIARPDKTNFWKYEPASHGVMTPPIIGLTGKGLSGTMDSAIDGDYFITEGIPLTNNRDLGVATMTPYPFQKASIIVRDQNNPKKVSAQLTVVASTSTELSCINCLADDVDATPNAPSL